MTNLVPVPQCARCGGVHTYADENCLRDVANLPVDTDFASIGFPADAPLGWRRVAPADCIGTPIISMQYAFELQRLAQEQGLEIRNGDYVTAKYRRVDGEWHPIPETLEVMR